jgi:transposase-like protein
MAQHFLYSAAAKSLTLAQIFRLSDDEAYDLLKSMRWEGGEPTCPHCGGCTVYEFRTRKIFKCKDCRQQFSLTSGTLFASYKRPLRDYLAAIAIFVNGAKGVSALNLSRDLGMAHKSAFVLLHKLREAMAADAPASLGGIVEVDGGWFGGYQREANYKADRIDRRYTYAAQPNRRAVVVARERGGRTATQVFNHEADGKGFIIAKLEAGAVVHTDESRGWDGLRHHFAMRRVNHTVGYSVKGACTNQAESYFSRLRRAEIGVHHSISGYLARYAAEMAWREDHRRRSNGEQFHCVATLALACGKSRTFTGYWQRKAA